jgi:hypothetical protein
MDSGSNGSALAVVETHPQPLAVSEYHRRATDVAGLVRAIVTGKAVQIGPRKYVPVDAYQAIANAMGCVASARDVRRVEGGYTAIGEVKRLSDGAVLAEGEGFVGDDEPKWSKGPEYARRSMVQTRAIGRACRAAFAFVVPMIDLGLSSTPAEEMEGINTATVEPPAPNVTKPVSRGTAPLRDALRPSPPKPANEPPPHTDADFRPDATHDRAASFSFGRDKGIALRELSESSLEWYADCFNKDLGSDDPKKVQYHDKTRAQLALVYAEMKHRGIH